jgi:molybdopterin/thiamine biosynthesis adenylyltransferase
VERAADWVRAFDPSIKVDTVDVGIGSAGQLGELLDRYQPNAVAAGIDHPTEVDLWVNAACVSRGIPFVRGGIWVTEGTVWSVNPRVSGCLECAHLQGPTDDEADEEMAAAIAGVRLAGTKPRINRGIGPVAGLLGALGAFELLRYLTGFEPPAYAGNSLIVDFANGCAMRQQPWTRHPGCPVCSLATAP